MIKKLLIFLLAQFLVSEIYAQKEAQVKAFKEMTTDITARTRTRYDTNDVACALVKVMCPDAAATFEGLVVGDVEFMTNEHWVYLARGAKRLRIHIPEAPTLDVEFSDYGIDAVESNVTYSLECSIRKNGTSSASVSVYLQGGMAAGSLMGPELAIGMYVGGFNVEASAMMPVGMSSDVRWNHATHGTALCTYKPSIAAGANIGYGIMIGEKFRITPQVGARFLKTSESPEPASAGEIASGAFCVSAVAALKLQYLFGSHISIVASPEYAIHVSKSNGYAALAEASETIGKWNNGIGGRIALNVEF